MRPLSEFSEIAISVLGSTGSIGRQTLDVCRSLGIRPVALTAHSNIQLLETQAREFLPQLVVVTEESLASSLKVALADTPVQVKAGPQALEKPPPCLKLTRWWAPLWEWRALLRCWRRPKPARPLP